MNHMQLPFFYIVDLFYFNAAKFAIVPKQLILRVMYKNIIKKLSYAKQYTKIFGEQWQ